MKAELTKEEKVKSSLHNSVLDGAFYSIKTGFADSFFSAFAVFLNATKLELGLLGSLPLAISSAFQLLSTTLMHKFQSRVKLIYTMGWGHGLSLLALILFYVFGFLTMPWMIFFIILYWSFDKLGAPAWNSLMGDLVSESKRGKYFGNRSRVVQIASFIGVTAGGGILSLFELNPKLKGLGFIAIFSLAFVARVISLAYLIKMYEPKHMASKKAHFTLFQFLKVAKKTNFGNFVMYYMVMLGAVFFAAPFFAAYMLNDVGLSYGQYTLLIGASVVIRFLTLPLWGHASDKYGTRKILALAGYIMPLVPIVLMLHTNFIFLLIANAFAGFVWGGFDLAAFNYLLDATGAEKRATCVMYHNFLQGIGIIIGSLLGTLLARNNIFWSSYVFVFLVSGILRFLTTIVFVPKLREIRKVEHISYNKLFFDVLTIRPIAGEMLRVITLPKKITKKLVKKN